TVGVGDGGNEIGMGRVRARLAREGPLMARIASIVPVDHPVVAGVSNWGAYGIVAQLARLTGRSLLHTPAEERRLIDACGGAGAGSRKWDVDGHEYVDYWMGHGALFLGHCHPAVVRAVQEQMARGTHLGASHEPEVRWAELVNELVPCAELTRFTMSGTEATHLAMRVARAYTGRPKILKLAGHFHGWHDGA